MNAKLYLYQIPEKQHYPLTIQCREFNAELSGEEYLLDAEGVKAFSVAGIHKSYIDWVTGGYANETSLIMAKRDDERAKQLFINQFADKIKGCSVKLYEREDQNVPKHEQKQ